MRVLLVEDNERLAEYVCKGLGAAGFSADQVGTLEDAAVALKTTNFDALVLDLGLPDGEGLGVVADLRSRGSGIPILIITARDGLRDRVTGLNAGADDYLLKPFEMEELVARLRALLRRPGNSLGSTLACGNVAFDTVAREVSIDGGPVPLSRRELSLLELFMRRFGRVVAKNVIEESLYGYDESASANSIEVLVHRLRHRLRDSGANLHVHTLRGVGYVLSDRAP